MVDSSSEDDLELENAVVSFDKTPEGRRMAKLMRKTRRIAGIIRDKKNLADERIKNEMLEKKYARMVHEGMIDE